jgi:hypothetical protein
VFARPAGAGEGPLTELMRCNDPVLLSYVCALLSEADVPHLVLDAHMSVLEGSIGAIARRLLVPEDHVAQARRILGEAGIADQLRDGA